MNRRQLVLGVVVVVAVLVVLLVGFALGRSGDDASTDVSRTITATGTGIVKAEPDVADVSLGVSATARTARAARIAADAQMARVLATVKRRGVASADIQTAQVSLSPNYGPGSRVVGYTATNTVTARIRKLDSAGRDRRGSRGCRREQHQRPVADRVRPERDLPEGVEGGRCRCACPCGRDRGGE